MSKIIQEAFNIDTGFHGTIISAFARLNLDHVVDDVNDETLDPWADLQTKAGISPTTPLSHFMEKELLKDSSKSNNVAHPVYEALQYSFLFCRYLHPQLNKVEIQRVIESYRTMGWWP